MCARSNKRCTRNSYRDIENIALSYTLRSCYYRATDKVKRANEYLLADCTYTLLLYPADRQSRQKKRKQTTAYIWRKLEIIIQIKMNLSISIYKTRMWNVSHIARWADNRKENTLQRWKKRKEKIKKENGALLIKRRPHPRHERPNSPLEHKSPDFSTAAR